MKLSEYLPEIPGMVRQQADLSFLINDLALMKSAGDTYRSPSLGLDLLYGAWVSQQMAYRQQLITQIMEFAKNVEEVRAPINHIIAEVFRRGVRWKPKFGSKCEKCQIEYSEEVRECKQCLKDSDGKNKGKMRDPDESQKKKFEPFFDDCNIWDNSFDEVLRAAAFDMNSCDDLFIHIVKEYRMMENGTVHSKPIEIRRLNPALIEWDLDSEGLPKNAHFLCYIHRDVSVASSPGKCDQCDLDLVPAMYKYFYRGRVLFLLDSEIVHTSKFYPTETFGFSPILTLMHKILTIRGMDLNLYRYFYERKMPSAMLMVFTDDAEALRREREHIAAKMRNDPNYIPMVAVSTKNSRGRVDMVRLFHTLQEMEYLPVREEIRERIAAMWGVTPAWQGAPDAFGGLSSKTQQLTVMSRVVESDQRIFHEKVFPQILEAFGITDWLLELPQPEEKAEATRIAFSQQRISAANMLVQMGFTVKAKSSEVGIDDIDFAVSGEAVTPMQQQQAMSGGGRDGMGEMRAMGGDMNGSEDTSSPAQGEIGAPMGSNSDGSRRSLGPLNKSPEMFMKQIQDRGYKFPIVKTVARDFSSVIFDTISNGLHKAKFDGGYLIGIEKYISPRMHRHGNHPMHNILIPHNNTMARQQRNEDKIFEQDTPEEVEVM